MALVRGSRGGGGGGGRGLEGRDPGKQRQALGTGVGVQAGGAVVEGLAHLADEAHEGRLGADVDDARLGVGGAGGGATMSDGLAAVDGSLVDFGVWSRG